MRNGAPEDVLRVTGDIDTLRLELGALVSELDRRRHELFDLRLQARRHPAAVALAAGAAALVLGGLLAVALRDRRRRGRPTARVREARRALARLLDHPQRVGAEPHPAVKIATAAGVAAGSAVARHLAQRFLDRSVRMRTR